MPLTMPTVDELVDELSQNTGWLESSYEAAAHLEAMGLSDEDARRFYGQPDVFALAEDVVRRQREQDASRTRAWDEERRRQTEEYDKHKPDSLLRAIPRFFIRGAVFGLPMTIMIIAILLLLYSLWAYYYFTVTRATAIGVGTALSYFIAGGITQAIGRRGLMYLRQGMFLLCLKVSAFFLALGVVLTLIVAAILWVFFAVFPVISPLDRNVAVLYYLTLSALWLCLALLYMLQREFLFSVAIALGIGVVYIFREWFDWPIIAAHQVGILSAAAFSLVCALVLLVFYHRRNKDPRTPISTKLPRVTMLMASVAPFLLFGFLYFGLLFADRIIAWTGRMPFRQSFIWFRTDYEVGLNWALLGLLPAFAALEYAIYRFSQFTKPRQLEYSLKETSSFRDWFMRFFTMRALTFLVMAIAGVLIAYFGVRYAVRYVPEIAIMFNDISVTVFWWAAVSYALIAFSLLNVSLFFWVSRPSLAIMAAGPALLVDIIVGFLLSRFFSYWWAVFGLFSGAVVFALLSLVLAIRVVSKLDYYYYSSF